MTPMGVAEVLRAAITGSVLLLVFALGLRATAEEATYLLRRPGKLARAILVMYVIVPGAAVLLAWLFEFRPPVEVALMATAISPVPPILPSRQLKAGGHAGYVYGLLVAMALCAILTVPLSLTVIEQVARRPLRIDVLGVAGVVGMTVLAPIILGILVRRFAPAVATRLATPVSRLGMVLLVVGLVPLLVGSAPEMWQLLGNGTLVAVALVVAVAVVAGHYLGGAEPGERTALVIASAMRHPGVALAVARLNAPDEVLVPAAVLVFVFQAAIVTTVYGAVTARRRRLPA